MNKLESIVYVGTLSALQGCREPYPDIERELSIASEEWDKYCEYDQEYNGCTVEDSIGVALGIEYSGSENELDTVSLNEYHVYYNEDYDNYSHLFNDFSLSRSSENSYTFQGEWKPEEWNAYCLPEEGENRFDIIFSAEIKYHVPVDEDYSFDALQEIVLNYYFPEIYERDCE